MRPGDAVGHEAGSGPLPAHAPICLDLWPQDEASGCWADMTRTWVRGDITDAVADLHRLVLEAHERALAALGIDLVVLTHMHQDHVGAVAQHSVGDGVEPCGVFLGEPGERALVHVA